MQKINSDVSLEDVGRVKNALDPIDPQDLVTKAWALANLTSDVESNVWQEVTYSGDVASYITYYNSATFITANRTARNDLTYTGDNLTQEVLKIYASDGTTILKTYTWTHTYSSDDYVSSSMVIT